MSNKDLDLPTQQELLAQFRCDEIANVTFLAFVEQCKVFSDSPGVGIIIPGLGASMLSVRTAALGQSPPHLDDPLTRSSLV